MSTRSRLGIVTVSLVLCTGITAYFLSGTVQVRAWGLVILGIGALFLIFGGFDIGSVDEAGPQKLGCIGLFLGAVMMFAGATAIITGSMPGGMAIPDWMKH
jgi:hypothetical protein